MQVTTGSNAFYPLLANLVLHTLNEWIACCGGCDQVNKPTSPSTLPTASSRPCAHTSYLFSIISSSFCQPLDQQLLVFFLLLCVILSLAPWWNQSRVVGMKDDIIWHAGHGRIHRCEQFFNLFSLFLFSSFVFYHPLTNYAPTEGNKETCRTNYPMYTNHEKESEQNRGVGGRRVGGKVNIFLSLRTKVNKKIIF